MVTSSWRALRRHYVPRVCFLRSRQQKEIKARAVVDLRVNFSVIHHESPAAAPTSGSLQAISDKEERGCLLICVKKKLPLPAFILQTGRGKNKAILALQTSTLGKVWVKSNMLVHLSFHVQRRLCVWKDGHLLFKVSLILWLYCGSSAGGVSSVC